MVDVHMRFLDALEQSRKLDRELEALPTNEQLAERNREDSGMTRPELAVALAYSTDLYAELLDLDLPEDPQLGRARALLPGAAATAVRRPDPRIPPAPRDHRHAGDWDQHGGRGGITFAFRLHRGERGAGVGDRPRVRRRAGHLRDAHAVGRDRGARQQGRGRGSGAHAARGTPAGGAWSRWLLAHRARPLDIGTTVHFFARGERAP